MTSPEQPRVDHLSVLPEHVHGHGFDDIGVLVDNLVQTPVHTLVCEDTPHQGAPVGEANIVAVGDGKVHQRAFNVICLL